MLIQSGILPVHPYSYAVAQERRKLAAEKQLEKQQPPTEDDSDSSWYYNVIIQFLTSCKHWSNVILVISHPVFGSQVIFHDAVEWMAPIMKISYQNCLWLLVSKVIVLSGQTSLGGTDSCSDVLLMWYVHARTYCTILGHGGIKCSLNVDNSATLCSSMNYHYLWFYIVRNPALWCKLVLNRLSVKKFPAWHDSLRCQWPIACL